MNSNEIAKKIAEKIKDEFNLFKNPINESYISYDTDMKPVIHILDSESRLNFVIKIDDVSQIN